MPDADVLQRGSAVPLYAQLERILRTKIASGEWRAGERMPSENELNRMYGVSRMTARGVLTRLVADGLVYRVAGKGTYVAPAKIDAVSPAYRGLREQLESLGYETTTTVLAVELRSPTRVVAENLGLSSTDKAFGIHRLRAVHGQPISVHHSYVPAALAPDLDAHDAGAEQLCVILDKHYGLAMATVRELLEAAPVAANEASLLGVRRGTPVLVLEDTIASANGTVFEYSRVVVRGDKLRIGHEYHV